MNPEVQNQMTVWICVATCSQATRLSMGECLSQMEISWPIFNLCKICHFILGRCVFKDEMNAPLELPNALHWL